MPIGLIKSLAQKGKKNPAEVEKQWDEIEKSVRKSNPGLKDDEVYKRVVGGIKNNLGIDEEIEEVAEEESDNKKLKGMVRVTKGPYKNLMGFTTGKTKEDLSEVKFVGQNLVKKNMIDNKTKQQKGPFLMVDFRDLEHVRESVISKIDKYIKEK